MHGIAAAFLHMSNRGLSLRHFPPPAGGASDGARLGALLALHHTVRQLGLALVPYCLLVVVPLLGRMSDAQPLARGLAARTFAAVVALMPLAQASRPGAGRLLGLAHLCLLMQLTPTL